MSKSQINKIIKEYAGLLRKNRIRFKKIYLFGSHATGRAHEYSDIDIAVIVPKIQSKGYLENKMRLRKLTAEIDIRIEPIILEEDEIIEGMASIMGNEILKHGILIETA